MAQWRPSEISVTLLVYCPDLATARWHERLFEPDGRACHCDRWCSADDVRSSWTRPWQGNPALAVLSAICHGGQDEVDSVFPALADALRALEPTKAILYHALYWPAATCGPDPLGGVMTTTADYGSVVTSCGNSPRGQAQAADVKAQAAEVQTSAESKPKRPGSRPGGQLEKPARPREKRLRSWRCSMSGA